MLLIKDIKLPIQNMHLLKETLAGILNLPMDEIIDYKIKKKSLDARKREEIHYAIQAIVDVKNPKKVKLKKGKIELYIEDVYQLPINKQKQEEVHIVGFGPSGMFAALAFARQGIKPIVYEQGESVDDREKSIRKFFDNGILNELSNIQFGEGGAGTFSDGKLTTRVKDARIQFILEELYKHGAPIDITYESYPHIGTDILKQVVKHIREEILQLNGEIHFNSKLTNIMVKDQQVQMIEINHQQPISVKRLVLALGNSSRDTFKMLHKNSVMVSAKPFAIGFRVEHKQSFIDQSQFKGLQETFTLPKAEYRLSAKTSLGKGVYTFCMCPGGTVVAATSQKGHVVVNGMSEHDRSKENANSAILVQVDHTDYGTGLWDGLEFIEHLEKQAYLLGKETYQAPAQLLEDYLKNQTSTHFKTVKPSYPLGTVFANLNDLFPPQLNVALKEGIAIFNQKIKGFAENDAILTAVETRTSSPIRIDRDRETYQSLTIKGVYPIGEGAGYAGGIMSSAIDGLRVAETIINELNKGENICQNQK